MLVNRVAGGERGANLVGECDGQLPLLGRRACAGERGHQEPALEQAAAFDEKLRVHAGREPVEVYVPAPLARGDRAVRLQSGRRPRPATPCWKRQVCRESSWVSWLVT